MKDNKLTILLNDRELLSEILKDKDVRIRVKDALIDGIGRRALKIMNIDDDFRGGIKKMVRETVFMSSAWRSQFSNEFKNIISPMIQSGLEQYVKETLQTHIDNIVSSELEDIYKEVKKYNQGITRQIIETYDIEKMIKQEIQNTVTKIIHRINESTQQPT
jgi:hypothetical protein